MQAKVQVLSIESHKSKKNEQTYHTLVCLDMDKGSNRMKNTVDYAMSAHDVEKYPDPSVLENQVVELGLNDVRAGFGGRYEFRGAILTAPKSAKA